MDIENNEKRTILFALMNGGENINSCQILAQILQQKGHRIVFSLHRTSKAFIETNDFEEEVFGNESDSEDLSQLDLNCLNVQPIDKIKNFSFHLIAKKFELIKKYEEFNQELVERVKPDLIVVESMVSSPALTNSGIPWVWLNFGPPNICKNDNRIPPGWSGIPKSSPKEWMAFKNQWNDIFKELKQQMNDWLASKGAPGLETNIFHPQSPYLNVYVYPKALDYQSSTTWETKNWLNFDCLMKRMSPKKFIIPDHLKTKPGKLVYFSMGSFASVELMKRLIEMMAESEHRFIVSKGPLLQEYQLPDNMYGLEDIPLLDVIQSVQLVVSNGDTKTVTQCLYYKKPLIILPLFGEQLDNRIRFKETGFGWGLDPFTCNKGTLLCMINSMIDDIPLCRRLATISNSMTDSNDLKQISQEIENLLNSKTTQEINENSLHPIDWENSSTGALIVNIKA